MISRKLILVLALAMPACVVHGRGSVAVRSEPGVVYQEPPPPQVETYNQRPGFVWVKGRWDWRNGQWVWMGGRWERERAGYAWSEGRWDRRGNQWIWVEGSWSTYNQPAPTPVGPPPDTTRANGGVIVTTTTTQPAQQLPPPVDTTRANGGVSVTVAGGPSSAPPALKAEAPGTKAGFVWVRGRWDWRNNQWAWIDGHWERARANSMWADGSWQLQGGAWVWVEGGWRANAGNATPPPPASGPAVRDHRRR